MFKVWFKYEPHIVHQQLPRGDLDQGDTWTYIDTDKPI